MQAKVWKTKVWTAKGYANLLAWLHINLFQLRLLQRRMMHDPCFIARGALSEQEKPRKQTLLTLLCYVSRTLRQCISKHWILGFNLRQWFEVRFFSVIIGKCCKFPTSWLGSCMWEFWMEIKKNQIQGVCWTTINNLTLRVYLFLRQFF